MHGVELLSAMPEQWEQIRAAFLNHLALFFPDQALDARALVTVGEGFGEPTFYPYIEGVPEEPRVIPLIKEPHERKNFGEGWHSDTTYTECPPKATMLYSVDIPPLGGDTLFANMYLAYESLSAGMRALLAPLRAVHSAAARKDGGRARGNAFQSVTFKNRDQNLEGIHPVVRTHPETGRRALYVDALHTARPRGHDRRGKPAAPRVSLPPHEPPGVHLPPPLGVRVRWRSGTIARCSTTR